MNNGLFEIAKSKCYLTGDISADEENRLNMIIGDAIFKVSHYIGVPSSFDFTQPGFARNLFENYVWYAFNDCEDDFIHNYMQDIAIAKEFYELTGDEND